MGLEEIFDTYYDRVYRFIFFRVRNIHDAEDISSEVFYRAARSFWRFDGKKANISTWLFTIVLNETRRYFRKGIIELPLEYAQTVEIPDIVAQSVLASEQARTLSAALERLEERQRTVVLLRYY